MKGIQGPSWYPRPRGGSTLTVAKTWRSRAKRATSDGLQPNSDGLQTNSDCLRPNSDGVVLIAMASKLIVKAFKPIAMA